MPLGDDDDVDDDDDAIGDAIGDDEWSDIVGDDEGGEEESDDHGVETLGGAGDDVDGDEPPTKILKRPSSSTKKPAGADA